MFLFYNVSECAQHCMRVRCIYTLLHIWPNVVPRSSVAQCSVYLHKCVSVAAPIGCCLSITASRSMVR